MSKYQLTLKQYRDNTGLDTKQVAEQTGINVRTIKRYEEDSTKANLFYLAKICRVYGLLGWQHVYIGRTPGGRIPCNIDITA
ncbi:helix-turn-helix domain-containing protein [Paenibacillus sp. strain BS8-2]